MVPWWRGGRNKLSLSLVETFFLNLTVCRFFKMPHIRNKRLNQSFDQWCTVTELDSHHAVLMTAARTRVAWPHFLIIERIQNVFTPVWSYLCVESFPSLDISCHFLCPDLSAEQRNTNLRDCTGSFDASRGFENKNGIDLAWRRRSPRSVVPQTARSWWPSPWGCRS